jgi:hypothetical protein
MGRKRELTELGKRGPGKKARVQPPPEILTEGISYLIEFLFI